MNNPRVYTSSIGRFITSNNTTMSHPIPTVDLDNVYPADDYKNVVIGNNGEEQTENDDTQHWGELMADEAERFEERYDDHVGNSVWGL